MSPQNTPSPKTNPNSENASATLEGEPIESANTVSTGNQDQEIQFFGKTAPINPVGLKLGAVLAALTYRCAVCC